MVFFFTELLFDSIRVSVAKFKDFLVEIFAVRTEINNPFFCFSHPHKYRWPKQKKNIQNVQTIECLITISDQLPRVPIKMKSLTLADDPISENAFYIFLLNS